MDADKELITLRSTVAALTADRDAAYRRGWRDAREAAADMAVMSNETRANLSASIRALQPPAPTEHDAKNIRSLIDYTKSKPQSQASLRDQLNALIELANINGLYDAADFVAGHKK